LIWKSALNLKVLFAFGATILTLLVAGGLSYRATAVSSASDLWVRHTYVVLQELQNLRSQRKVFSRAAAHLN